MNLRLAILLAAGAVLAGALAWGLGPREGAGAATRPPGPAAGPAAEGAASARAARDLEELVRQGGRLPPGYVPGLGVPREGGARVDLAGATLAPAMTAEGDRCAEVVALAAGSPAAQAGLAVGDLVLEVGGAPFDPRRVADVAGSGRSPEGIRIRWRRPGEGDHEATLPP